jgi:hypothetical protein
MIQKYQSSSIFSIDASYKVLKWMASWIGQKMYGALITSKDKYFESLMSFFALSDNYKELNPCSNQTFLKVHISRFVLGYLLVYSLV